MERTHGFPLQDFLEMALDSPAPGHAVARLALGPQHLNPNGVVHGGVLFTMIDTAMGQATMSVLPEGSRCASIEIHIRFLRPAMSGTIEAEASVVRPGRRIVHLDARAVGEAGKLLASASGTFAVID